MAKGDTAQRAHREGQRAAKEGKPRNRGFESFRSDAANKGYRAGHDNVRKGKRDK
ncbi:MAG: hypothetical protein QOH67_4956 [Hyphomicrobiales bacterium]|jgi:hypothetical protein|nr:hypothetical protein [Hyphomicrobiales bacterium]